MKLLTKYGLEVSTHGGNAPAPRMPAAGPVERREISMDATTPFRPLPADQAAPTPWRPPGCDTIALVLQGGGALGAYQAGAYQALHEAGLEPDTVAGVSIGGINAAIIAGNPPER